MAEAPPRYCANCGHELRPEDQFCSNCGAPVHRAARVPTPEADVPVPPPLSNLEVLPLHHSKPRHLLSKVVEPGGYSWVALACLRRQYS